MSDADNQMGGTGGETGPDPDKVQPGKDNAAPVDADKKEGRGRKDKADQESEDSFPASDPPGNY